MHKITYQPTAITTATATATARNSNSAPELDGEEKEDAIYFEKGGLRGNTRRVMKWKFETQATITPGPNRGEGMEEGYTLDLFARGTSIACYKWVEASDAHQSSGEQTDRYASAGEQTPAHWEKETLDFLDMLNFQLTNKKLGTVICSWSTPGDLEDANRIQVFRYVKCVVLGSRPFYALHPRF